MAKEKLYPFAVARVRMLERSLLSEKQYNQMAESKSVDDALKVLMESGYGDGVLTEKNYFEALSKKLSKAYEDVSELISDKSFMDVFLIKNDYHNCKVLIKDELTKSQNLTYLVDGGTLKKSVIENAFLTKTMETLPYAMNQAVSKAYEAFGKTMNGQMVDIVLDKATFKEMKNAANKSGNSFVNKYMECYTDLTNLKSFLRVKNMKKTIELFSDVFVEGGSLNLDIFRMAFGGETPSVGFKNTVYSELVESMNKGFTIFEKECDNFIMSIMKDARYKSLTIEPMVAYIYAVETEVKTIRIIISSKQNNIDTDIIKERLRDAYV